MRGRLPQQRLLASVVSLAALVAVGCAGEPKPAALLPLHIPLRYGMLATLDGTLILTGRCLTVDEGGKQVLPIWPTGTTFNGTRLQRDGTEIGSVGRAIRLTGGFLDYADLRPNLFAEVPEPCRLGTYFLVDD